MTAIVTVAIALTLLFWSFYVYVSNLRYESDELRELEKVELQLAHILRLLEAPDVRMLLEDETKRLDLFLEFSVCLKEDVQRLARNGSLGIKSFLIVTLFLLTYHLLRLKARLSSGRNDLQFLSGIELALFRSMR
jgi:hypothetical protein